MKRVFLVLCGSSALFCASQAQVAFTPTAPVSTAIGPWTYNVNRSVSVTTAGNTGTLDVVVSGHGELPFVDINSASPSQHVELGLYQGISLTTGAGQVTIDSFRVTVNHQYDISADNTIWSQTNGFATLSHGSVTLDNELFTPFSVGTGSHFDNRTNSIGAGTILLTNTSYDLNVGNLLYCGRFDPNSPHNVSIGYFGTDPYTGVHFQMQYHVVPEPMTLSALSFGLMLIRKRRLAQ